MTKTARIYGGALYDLACEEGLSEQIFGELKMAAEVFRQNPDYRKLLCTPVVPKEERNALLEEAWGGRVHPYVTNFLKLLCDKGTLGQFSDCAEAFKDRYYADEGIIEVRAVCAYPMNQELSERLRRKVEKLTGKKVELTCVTDRSVLGGVRLELPDRQYDGTVSGQLANIRKILSEASV